FFLFDLIVLADRRAGGLFAYFAVIVILGALFHLVDGRFLGKHGVEIEDLAQLHFLVIERFGPLDDGMEGDRAFAQAHDHRVAPGLDALCDGDFAFAAEQLDRAHFAQIHAHRIVGAFGTGRLFLLGNVAVFAIIVVRGLDLVGRAFPFFVL